MDAILHIIGLCNDTHTHIDIIDIFMLGTGGTALVYLKHSIKDFYTKFRKK